MGPGGLAFDHCRESWAKTRAGGRLLYRTFRLTSRGSDDVTHLEESPQAIGTAKSSTGRYRTRRAQEPGRGWHLLRLEERILLSTFTVTNTLDNTKAGSLRWAITQVNADKGNTVDTIDFNIPGTGPFTISPDVGAAGDHALRIHQWLQPAAFQSQHRDGQRQRRHLDPVERNAARAFRRPANHRGNSTVRGLAINQFEQYGIRTL